MIFNENERNFNKLIKSSVKTEGAYYSIVATTPVEDSMIHMKPCERDVVMSRG